MKKTRILSSRCFVQLQLALEEPAYTSDIPRVEEDIDNIELYRGFIKRNT